MFKLNERKEVREGEKKRSSQIPKFLAKLIVQTPVAAFRHINYPAEISFSKEIKDLQP